MALAAVIWIGLLLTAPILISLYSSDLPFHDAVVAAPRDAFTISQPVVLPTSPVVRVERGTIIVVDSSGKPTSGAATEAALASGAANLVIQNGVLNIGPGAAAAAAAEPQAALAPLVQSLATLGFETLGIRRGAVQIALPGGGLETLSDVQANVSLKRKGQVTIKGTGQLRGHKIQVDATTGVASAERKPQHGAPAGAAGPRLPVKVALKGELIDVSFEGRLATESWSSTVLQGQGEMSVPRVRRLARSLGAYWPTGSGLENLVVNGQIELSSQAIAFEKARVRLDGNEATGALGLALSGERPQLTGTLAFTSLDIMPYLAETRPEEGLSLASLATGTLSAPLGMHLDADLRLSAGRVKAGPLELGNAATTVTLKSGHLLADLAELAIAGGTGAGQLRADFTGFQPKLSFRGKLSRVELARLGTAMTGHTILQAPATLIADLTATGGKTPELLRTLGGRLSVKSDEAGRIGIDLRGLAAAAEQSEQLLGWMPAAKGSTPFEQLDLRLILRDGVLLTDTAEVVSGDSRWTATGLLNLPASRIDLRVLQSPLAGAVPATPAKTGVAARASVLEMRGEWTLPLIKSLTDPNGTTSPDLRAPASTGAIPRPDRG